MMATGGCPKSIRGLRKKSSKKKLKRRRHTHLRLLDFRMSWRRKHKTIQTRLNIRHRLRNLHEVLVASFGEVNAQCLPFPTRNAPIENFIDWLEEEVKAIPGTVWQLNDNFIVLAIEDAAWRRLPRAIGASRVAYVK
jgi:hypothetical protein